MPVSVVMPNSGANERNIEILGTALSLARDFYKVKMDDKALDAANKLSGEKETRVAAEKKAADEVAFNKEFVLAPEAPNAFQLPGREGRYITRAEAQQKEKMAFDASQKERDRRTDLEKASMLAQTKADGNKITGQMAEDIGNLKTVGKSIDALGKDWESLASQKGASISQFMPGSFANQYNNKARVAVQNIGYALEGGKMTDSDREFYGKMTPTATDNADQKNSKIKALKEYAQRKWEGKLSALKESGFNVANIETPDFGLQEEKPKTELTLSPELQKFSPEEIKAAALNLLKQRQGQTGTASK